MALEKQQFYYKSNRLQQLRGFCYTAQFGSISRAADHMGLTHSSVSIQIKSLAEDLGVRLLDRNGPHIALTLEGEELFKFALPLIDNIQNLEHLFKEHIQESVRTDLDIAVNSTALNFILPRLSKRFIDENPDHFLHIHYAEHFEAIEKLMKDQVDLAILPHRAHWPFPAECIYTPLFYYTPCLITKPNHPLAGRRNLSVEEISQYELTLPAPDLRVIPNLYDVFPQNRISKKLRVNFINWETTRKYIEEGLVISISSDVIIGKDDTLVATPLPHLFARVDYGIIVKRSKPIPHKVNRFIELAKLYKQD